MSNRESSRGRRKYLSPFQQRLVLTGRPEQQPAGKQIQSIRIRFDRNRKGEYIISEEKKVLEGQELENTNGGYGNGGYYMTVGNCNGSYLALRPQPVWDQYHELAHMWPGNQVFTYGQTTNGTGLNGIPATYTYVCFNGTWGWANSSFLR